MSDDHDTPTEQPPLETAAPEHTPVHHVSSAPGGTTGRQRLLRGLTGRPSRGQLIVAALLCILGVAAATQIRLTRSNDDFSGQRREDLVDLLDSLSSANDRARTQLDDLEQTRTELQSSSKRRQAAVQEGQNRLAVLGILSGSLAATGPGVTITVNDPDGTVSAATLLDGVEELRDAGAEAIEINDSVRVVASTSFTDGDGGVVVDSKTVRPPYVIDAIGGSHTLSEAVIFRGGFRDSVERDGGTLDVHEADVVEVGSLHPIQQPEYAQPTDR
jgi:uncharacterized protein YlxW (UPF0749 family)